MASGTPNADPSVIKVDLSSSTPNLDYYTFVRASGADATMSGYFVDSSGRQCTNFWTGTISSTGKTLRDLYGAALPAAAVGAIVILTLSDVYMGLNGLSDNTITEQPQAGYPKLAQADYITLGRVG